MRRQGRRTADGGRRTAEVRRRATINLLIGKWGGFDDGWEANDGYYNYHCLVVRVEIR